MEDIFIEEAWELYCYEMEGIEETVSKFSDLAPRVQGYYLWRSIMGGDMSYNQYSHTGTLPKSHRDLPSPKVVLRKKKSKI
ncbi:MAG: hypothetical protein OEX12_00300 [Gammaproteobacteria bacterium]|nr:hypothetical protein [Gammaproteobacteria bacterium]